MLQVELLQFLELTYRLWDIAIEDILSKINFARFVRLIMRAPSSTSYKWLLREERYSREVPLNISSGSPPLRLFWSALSPSSMEQISNRRGMLALKRLKNISSIWNDGELLQIWVGIFPLKLVLLALPATRLFITSHVVDGNCLVNKLLKMFSIAKATKHRTMSRGRGWGAAVQGGSQQTDRETHTLRPARSILVTVLFGKQVIPSHLQKSMLPFHEVARPPSCDSPTRNWRRELFSSFVHELVGLANEISSTRERPGKELPLFSSRPGAWTRKFGGFVSSQNWYENGS